jgi:hypothetical protein
LLPKILLEKLSGSQEPQDRHVTLRHDAGTAFGQGLGERFASSAQESGPGQEKRGTDSKAAKK